MKVGNMFNLEKKAFIETVNMLEDIHKCIFKTDLNEYFRRFEENSKDTYSFKYVEYHNGETPITLLCYVFNNDVTNNQRQVAFSAIDTSAVPKYTPIMIHKGENSLVGYPSDFLEPYVDHVSFVQTGYTTQ